MYSPQLEWGLGVVTHFWWMEWGQRNGMSLLRWGYEKTVTSVLFTLSRLLSFFLSWKPPAICKLPYGETHMAKNWWRPPVNNWWGADILSPPTCKALGPANHRRVSWEAAPSSEGPRGFLSCFTVGNPEGEDLARLVHKNCEVRNICCFKLLSFCKMCYAAIRTRTLLAYT